MNCYEKRMLDIIKELKNEYGAVAVKSEFEAEGARTDELVILNEVVFRADMDMYIKIGGCEAVCDMEQCRILGAKGIIAPMIESPFAMQKFIGAIDRVYSQSEQDEKLFIFNAETITGYHNLDAILQVDGIAKIHSIAVGRGDFTASLGYGRDKINSDEITKYTREMLEKARACGIETGIGGGITYEAVPVVHELGDIVEKIETRKIVFGYNESINIKQAIILAMEFEILHLKNKTEFYKRIATEDVRRIQIMEERLKKFS